MSKYCMFQIHSRRLNRVQRLHPRGFQFGPMCMRRSTCEEHRVCGVQRCGLLGSIQTHIGLAPNLAALKPPKYDISALCGLGKLN